MALNARWIPKFTLNDIVRATIGLAVVAFFLSHEAEWRELRFLQQLELWAYDARIRLFLPKTRDTRVVILDIDEKSLNAEGRFPWPRNKLALMVKQLFERYQVRTVGFDIALPEPDTSSGLPVFEAVAQNELKDNAEYLAFLKGARASLNYDQILADEMVKWPVVLGMAMGGKEDISGVLPRPVFDAKALGRRPVPLLHVHGLQRQHRAAAAGGDRHGTLLSRARHRRHHPARADVHALPGRLLRGPLARRGAHLPRKRRGEDHPRRAAQDRRAHGRMDAVYQDRRRGGSARPRDDRDGPLPRRGRLPLRLGDRRDPGNASAGRIEGQDRHRGHLRPGPRGPAGDFRAGGPAGRRGPCDARGRHPRRHDQEPAARGARHHDPAPHADRPAARHLHAAPVGHLVDRRRGDPLRRDRRGEPLPLAGEELGRAHRLSAAHAGAALLPEHGLRLLRRGTVAAAHHRALRHLRAAANWWRRCRRTPANTPCAAKAAR
ncbi:MAG: CHASE2 domain-containing protein [Betaproteobacteria bacterium]|nr:CHASE2 domain-containing protein [Betaproteobacteria bacterium]